MEIKNRYILLAVVLNFTKFLSFVQEKPTYFATPTSIYIRFCVYIGVFVKSLRYKRLSFSRKLLCKTTNVIRYRTDNIYVINK